jgi:hypothetical protein
MTETSTYRIELHRPDESVRTLGYTNVKLMGEGTPLDERARAARAERETGVVYLIDQATGAIAGEIHISG